MPCGTRRTVDGTGKALASSMVAITLAALMSFATLASAPAAKAETVRAAVATNFIEPVARIAAAFKEKTGHEVVVSTGATGSLSAQIKAGAPFDVFLSADSERPAAMENEGVAVRGSRFTYAVGILALWSADPARITGEGKAALEAADIRAIAIADPALAPYGHAAKQTLEKLGLWDAVEGKLVFGKNIGQTHALVATGNAEIGFVALSALKRSGSEEKAFGSTWQVPEGLHDPIRQDAVLLAPAETNAAARAFLEFLKSAEAREVITAHGYGGGD
ncbi:MAG: molybdate ABC transporter substrate-binding protein [Hyphomicrobiaceae bacterium]|nr:molybdate ABC transporter substrate-binding protein [Hyphomicrobiaceae bacterium]